LVSAVLPILADETVGEGLLVDPDSPMTKITKFPTVRAELNDPVALVPLEVWATAV
jgi:hypothetical protein